MAKRIVGIRVERSLLRVPSAEPVGCIEFDEIDCCSGSGSGGLTPDEECVTTCIACLDGISGSWTVASLGIQVIHITSPANGNTCWWVSNGGVYTLEYVIDDDLWVLTNNDTGEVWAQLGANWNCNGDNTMVNADLETIIIENDYDCPTTPSAPCPDGTNYTVATVTDKTGDCTCLPDTLSSIGPSGGSVNSWVMAGCPGNIPYDLFCTDGQYRFFADGVEATLVSYAVGTIVYQLHDLGANCGVSGGSAKVTITGTP